MLLQSRPDAFSAATRFSSEILNRLSRQSDAPIVAPTVMERLAQLIDCLPLDQAAYCYFRNRLNSTRHLLATGETAVARYQLREMTRKLSHLAACFR